MGSTADRAELDILYGLATEAGAGPEDLRRDVSILVTGTEWDPKLERRKWRLALVAATLDALPNDPIYGLIDLTELWGALDYPDDGPHVVVYWRSPYPQDES